MSRESRGHKSPLRRPEQVELSEKHIGLRLTLTIVMAVVAICALGYAFYNLLSAETGWQQIQAKADAETTGAKELSFLYNIGASGIGATAELKQVTAIYSEAVDEAYKLYSGEPFEGVINMPYLNEHLNRPIAVSDELYASLELIQQTGSRFLFMAPLVSCYDTLFQSNYDEEAQAVDPYYCDEVREDLARMAAFANDPRMIDLKLEAGNLVTIVVSEEYLAFAEEYGIECFADFSWMRNAFIVDYVADRLISAGHRLGTLSSFDGYCRALDNSGRSYSFNVYALFGGAIQNVAMMNYTQPISLVYYRCFPKSQMDSALHYYTYDSGEIRAPYLDAEDGLCKTAVDAVIGYSDSMSTAEIALRLLPHYATELLDEAALVELQQDQLYTVWCQNQEIRYTGDLISFSNVYQTEQLTYTVKQMTGAQ